MNVLKTIQGTREGLTLDIDRVVSLVNLTPHPITVQGVTYETAGLVVRLDESGDVRNVAIENVFGYVSYRTVESFTVTNLPEPRENVVFVVSRPVAQVVQRADVVALDRFERDDSGDVVGAHGLVSFHGLR